MDNLDRLVAKKRIHGVAAMLAREENRELQRVVDQLPTAAARIARYRAELQHLMAVAQGASEPARADEQVQTQPATPPFSSPLEEPPPPMPTDEAHPSAPPPADARCCGWAPCGKPLQERSHHYCSRACRQKAKWARDRRRRAARTPNAPLPLTEELLYANEAEVTADG